MVEFTDVLLAVEERAVADRSAASWRRFDASSVSSSPFDPAPTPNASVLAAYLAAREAETPEPVESELTTTEICARITRDLAASRGSPRRLRALRREIAWLFHPDRCASNASAATSLLARFNAEIDAAIGALRA